MKPSNVLDTDALVNATKCFKNHEPSILDKVIQNCNQKEIVQQDILALTQLLLGGVKIEIHIQMFDKFCNRVTIGIRFLCTILNIFLWNTSILYQILLALTC